jgi:hypothetical protein
LRTGFPFKSCKRSIRAHLGYPEVNSAKDGKTT